MNSRVYHTPDHLVHEVHGTHPRLNDGRHVLKEAVVNPRFRVPAENVERSVRGKQGNVHPCAWSTSWS